jgi:hypothetical protein
MKGLGQEQLKIFVHAKQGITRRRRKSYILCWILQESIIYYAKTMRACVCMSPSRTVCCPLALDADVCVCEGNPRNRETRPRFSTSVRFKIFASSCPLVTKGVQHRQAL